MMELSMGAWTHAKLLLNLANGIKLGRLDPCKIAVEFG
jgi:hypothetical protein